MEKIRLGRTGLLVTKTAFGALPIQRISKADAVKLVRRACEAGINYFDTARRAAERGDFHQERRRRQKDGPGPH